MKVVAPSSTRGPSSRPSSTVSYVRPALAPAPSAAARARARNLSGIHPTHPSSPHPDSAEPQPHAIPAPTHPPSPVPIRARRQGSSGLAA